MDSPKSSSCSLSFSSVLKRRSSEKTLLSGDPSMSPSNNSSSSLKFKCFVKDSAYREVQNSAFVQEHGTSLMFKSNRARVPSVVAKLMGLETLPDSASCSETNVGSCLNYGDKDLVKISNSFEKTGSSKQIQLSGSIRYLSLFPMEPASWKKINKTISNQEMASRNDRGPMKIPYSEIEKRLEDLEFLLSGTDHGAVEQVTEAIHGDSEQQLESCGSSLNYDKFYMEKRFHTPASPNSIKSKTQSRMKQCMPKSSVGRRRLKDLDFQRSDVQSSELDVAISNTRYSEIEDTASEIAPQASDSSFVWTSSEFGSTFEISRKRLKDIDSLVEKLERLNSDQNKTCIDPIASLCEKGDQDHRYVSEILLASGFLLRDVSSSSTDFHFHSSGYPLNPELFLVLEQAKASSSSSNKKCHNKITSQSAMKEKLHRRLIFDTVNEILVRRLSSFAGPRSDPWSRTLLNSRKLLRETCSEIEGLRSKNSRGSSNEVDEQWKTILSNDVVHQPESDFGISGAVLDIERLIFKDLVKEIIIV